MVQARRALIAFCIGLAAPLPAHALTEGERAAAQAAAPAGYVDPGLEVDQAFNRYFSEGTGKALMERASAGEIYVGRGSAEVAVGPGDPQWSKYRVLAYAKALTDAEDQFLLAQSTRLRAQKLRKYFSDNSNDLPDWDDNALADRGQLERVVEKLLTVTEGKLDRILNDQGVDPAQFNAAPKPQRHLMLSDALIKNTVKESLGSLAGLVPVKSFEAHNTKGEHVIGVVVVVSERMKRFAQVVATRRGHVEPDPELRGMPLRDLIAQDEAQLVDQFGIRRLHDENGYPVLVSYGQWGNSFHGDDQRQLRRQRSDAYTQARNEADHQIAMFVAGRAMVSEQSSVGQLVDNVVDVHRDGYKEQREIARVVDEIHKRSEARATVTLSGITDLYTWARPHPLYPDHELVGVVRVWSPVTERNMRTLREGRPHGEAVSGENGVRTGKSYMGAEDF